MRRPTTVPPELPGYTYVKLLGSGGFSDVFLYDQHLPKRRVAVKVLLTEELTATNRAAFVAEANLMAQLSAHPYIVSIFHVDIASDDRPYFVMEYCSGPSLAERYKREPLAVADVLRSGIRVAGAVATAHAAGILHRDIEPANVLTNDNGWPTLTGFGISSAVAVREMSVPWSPREMFEDDPTPDVRADVFSLAATLYTLLAGHTPFEAPGRSNDTLDLIGRIKRGLVTPLERRDVPRSLVAVLAKGMASNREDRFPTAVEFARAMQRVELELNYAPTTIDVPSPIVDEPEVEEDREPDSPQSKANRRVLWLAGSAAVVIAAGVAVSLMVTGLPAPVETEPVTPGGSGVAVVEQIPTPVLVSATSDGATVTFTVANPDPQEGDSMLWRRTDRGASEPPHQVSDGRFTVDDSSTVCVEVHVIRAGRESANPLETCYPE